MVHAVTHRILTERTGNGQLTAVGVEFQYNDTIYVVNATEEVILAAGYAPFVTFHASLIHVLCVAPYNLRTFWSCLALESPKCLIMPAFLVGWTCPVWERMSKSIRLLA